ncbi:Uncharacterised protein [Legionella jordanis]|nr:Uncharacterised protein [Legionella jordanis]
MCTMTITKRFSLIFLLAFGINATLKASSLKMEQYLKQPAVGMVLHYQA